MEINRVFHYDVEQQTPEWHVLRAGKVTGTTGKTLLVKGKGERGFGAGAITQLYRIVGDRLKIEDAEDEDVFIGNSDTDFGNENESEAVLEYERRHMRKGVSVGFVSLNDWIGSSPDKIFPEIKMGLEVKCRPKEHIKMLLQGKDDLDEYRQCQWNLWVTGYDRWVLIHFNPNYKGKARYSEKEFTPDVEMFKEFEEVAPKFIELAKDKITLLS